LNSIMRLFRLVFAIEPKPSVGGARAYEQKEKDSETSKQHLKHPLESRFRPNEIWMEFCRNILRNYSVQSGQLLGRSSPKSFAIRFSGKCDAMLMQKSAWAEITERLVPSPDEFPMRHSREDAFAGCFGHRTRFPTCAYQGRMLTGASASSKRAESESNEVFD